MRCKHMNGYNCGRDNRRCLAYFRSEKGNEGINDSVLRISSCYDGPGKLIIPRAFRSNLESVSSNLSAK